MTYKRIKDMREDSDLTQEKISAYLNISQRAYSHFETGSRCLPVDILVRVADFYNVSVDYLLERTNKKEVNR